MSINEVLDKKKYFFLFFYHPWNTDLVVSLSCLRLVGFWMAVIAREFESVCFDGSCHNGAFNIWNTPNANWTQNSVNGEMARGDTNG